MSSASTLTLLELFGKIMPNPDAARTVASLEALVDDRTKAAHEDTTKTVDTKLHHVATKEDVANLRTELKTDMKDLKIDMIKWMISLLVWQTGIILGVVYFLFKAMQNH